MNNDRFKFRFFSKELGKLIYFDMDDLECGTIICGEFCGADVVYDDVEQCTGLKDKNDKLIWECDIVKVDGLVDKVIYSQRWCEFKIVAANCLGWYKDIEIVGNIHENPELLEAHDES